MTDYMDDREMTWAAIGLLAFLLRYGLDGFDDVELLLLQRGAAVWHPDDRGDFGDAWDVLLSLGYVEQDYESKWQVFADRGHA